MKSLVEPLRELVQRLSTPVGVVLVSFLVSLTCVVAERVPSGLSDMAFIALCLGIGCILASIELFLQASQEQNEIRSRGSTIGTRLMWRHSFQFIGFYDASMVRQEIELREGGTPVGLDPVACVMEGIDTFGVTTAVDLIRRYYEDARFRETEIVPCYLVFRESPVVVISNDSEALSLDGLNGKRIAFYGRSDSTFREFSVLCKDADLEVEYVFLEDAETMKNPISPLIRQVADVRVGYAFNEGLLAERQGYAVRRIVEIFGKNLYSDVVCVRLSGLCTEKEKYLQIFRALKTGFLTWSDPTQVGERINRIARCKHWGTVKKSIPGEAENLGEVESLCRRLSSFVSVQQPDEYHSLIGRPEDWYEMEKIVMHCDRKEYTSMLQSNGLFELLSLKSR